MTISRTGASRSAKVVGAKAVLAILALAGGLTAAEAAPAFVTRDAMREAVTTPVQYGGHGGWGHHHHDDGPRYGGHGYGRGRHEGWGHRRHHGWDHHGGWGHRRHHHHHHHHGRYDD